MSKKSGRLYFLGTGTSQGVPVIGCSCEVCTSSNPKDRRSRSSVHVVYDGLHLQIDTGPDFRQQMLNAGLTHVDAVLFTHEHQDHIAGLDDTRPIIFRTGNEMLIYGQQRVINRIKKVYDYAFEPQHYPGAPRIHATPVEDGQKFSVNGVYIQSLPVIHGRLPILGYRIGELAYLTDTNNIPEPTYELLEGLDVLVIDALHHRDHFSHYTLEQAVEQAKKIGAKRTFFIHMSHYMGLHKTISSELPENMYLSYDGLEVCFD